MASYVQVISQWKNEETTILFDISKFKNHFKYVKKIEIVNVFFCDSEEHNHFTNPKKRSAYPSDEIYQEKIRIQVPRPQPVQYRRRTVYLHPNLQLNDDFRQEEEDISHRYKRSITDSTERERKKRTKREINPYNISTIIEFTKPEITSSIQVAPDYFLDKLLLRLNVSIFENANNHFNNIMLGEFNIETRTDEDDREILQLTLPAKTSIVCKCSIFFVH